MNNKQVIKGLGMNVLSISFLVHVVILCMCISVFGQPKNPGAIPLPLTSSAWTTRPYFLSESGLAKSQTDLAKATFTAITYPSHFCLNDGGILVSPTHSMDQGEYGTCWACALTHALEIETKRYLIESSTYGGPGLPYSAFNINLSERQLITQIKKNWNSAYEWLQTLYELYIPTSTPEIGGFDALLAADCLNHYQWTIPLEGDCCYSPFGSDNLGQNGYIVPPNYPFDWLSSTTTGIVFNGYPEQVCDREDILAIKYALYNFKKGVIVSINADEIKDALANNIGYLDALTGVAVDHQVCIIGWDINPSVLDIVTGKIRSLGPSWIVKNSWGKCHHCVATGENENWFYMRMMTADDYAQFTLTTTPYVGNAQEFSVLSGNVELKPDKCTFINRLYTAQNLDCNNDVYSHCGWCGNEIADAKNMPVVTLSNGASTLVNSGLRINLSHMTAPNGYVFAAQTYIGDEYAIGWTKSVDGGNFQIYWPYVNGTSNTAISFSQWANITGATNYGIGENSVSIVTYVWHIKAILNGESPQSIDQWIPCKPNQATAGFTYTPYEASTYNCQNPCATTGVTRSLMKQPCGK